MLSGRRSLPLRIRKIEIVCAEGGNGLILDSIQND